MSLVTVQGLTLSFAGRVLFDELGFQVQRGDRIGLVGPNGSGKTSLMRVLSGMLQADKGDVHVPKGVELGYLAQDLQDFAGGTVLGSVLSRVEGRSELETKIHALETQLETESDEETQIRLGHDLGEAHTRLAELDQRYPRHEAERILAGLGFPADELERDLSTFSGGWKMRAALAGLLFLQPEVLLLDEPTNHLDIPSVRWLEGFLANYPGAFLLICHDRDFLDRQVTKVFGFEPEGFRQSRGNYTSYLAQREEEADILEGARRNQEQKIKEAKRFIDRFRSKASKARQAQSKIKLLEKIELVETHSQHKTMKFRFPEVARSGRRVLHLDRVTKSFSGPPLYRDVDLLVERGDKIAVIGANGAGKTTLLKIGAGELGADSGDVRLGQGVEMSYFAQHHSEGLDLGQNILREVAKVVPHKGESYVRGILGAFLFTGDDVEKDIRVLSGGEKARVALAKVLVSQANFLVMDEPTNHLDLYSTEILVDALKDFGGTLLFVSHNQGFVSRLANKVWDVRDGTVHEYPGGLYEYFRFREGREPEPASTPSKSAKDEGEASAAPKGKEARQARAEARRKARQVLGPLQKRIQTLEGRISKLETKEAELSQRLADPAVFADKETSVPLLKEHGEVRKKLEELMARWEAAEEELEVARTEFEDESE